MSYLVDALSKAERDRHRDRVADIGTLSTATQPQTQRSGGRRLRWAVAVLVACNIALLLYLLLPRTPEAIGSTAALAAVPAPAAAADGSSGSPEAAGAPPRVESPQIEAPRVDPDPGRAQRRQPAAAPANSWPGGREPFPETGGGLQATPAPATPIPAADDVPQVTINGHLYSTTPGQSFILVAGRVYHEGERLASGPAIVRIDDTGAILNYRGRRYHVDGPG